MTRYRDRYEEIFELLSPSDLQRDAGDLDDVAVGPELFEPDDRWLGFYTEEGLRVALRKYGFFRDLERLGFREFEIETKIDDPDRHLFRLWSTRPALESPLIELVARRDLLRPDPRRVRGLVDTPVSMLTIDWLLMQNPRGSFTDRRPPLPGQRHPGLGVGAQVLEMLRNICRRLELGGIATVPSYFHNALFYSPTFRHFDPRWEGHFQALKRDVIPAVDDSVVAASWALQWKLVRESDRSDAPVEWFRQLMIAPVSEALLSYVDSPGYRRQLEETKDDHHYTVVDDPLDRRLRDRGIAPFDETAVRRWIDAD